MNSTINNATANDIALFFGLPLVNITNASEIAEDNLFSLYEAYEKTEREWLTIYKIMGYIVGTLIIISNLTVVVSSGLILHKGQQPKSTYILLGNVSLADTIVGVSILFGMIVDRPSTSSPLCVIQTGMIVCPAMVSIFSVGLIAVDRYIYILHGLYYQRWFNTTRVRIGIVCIWMIGVFIASVPAMGWTGTSFADYRCWYITVFPPVLLIVISIIVLSVIIVVCILYYIILYEAVKTANKIEKSRCNELTFVSCFDDDRKAKDEIATISGNITSNNVTEHETSTNVHKGVISKDLAGSDTMKCKIMSIFHYYTKARTVSTRPRKLKAIRTVLLVTACFVITWAPYYIAVIMYVKCDIMIHGYDCVPLELLTLGPLFLLGVCNCLCDPIIYAWRHSGFNRAFRKMYWGNVRNFKCNISP